MYFNSLRKEAVEAFHVDGRQLWSYKVDGQPCPLSVVIGDVIYTSTAKGKLYGLCAVDGVLLWQCQVPPLPFVPPTLHKGVLYVSSVAHSSQQTFISISEKPSQLQPLLYALQASDGALLWRVNISAATMFPLAADERALYMSVPNGCTAFHLENGSFLWHQKIEGICRSEPVILNDTIVFSASVFHRTSPFQSGQVRQWQQADLYALRTTDGTLYWKQPLLTTDAEYGSLAIPPLLERTNPRVGPLGGDPTTPVVTDDTIYVGVGGTLLALHLQTGTLLWHYRTEGTFLSPPQATNGMVFVGANNGCVYALQAKNGVLLWQIFLESQ